MWRILNAELRYRIRNICTGLGYMFMTLFIVYFVLLEKNVHIGFLTTTALLLPFVSNIIYLGIDARENRIHQYGSLPVLPRAIIAARLIAPVVIQGLFSALIYFIALGAAKYLYIQPVSISYAAVITAVIVAAHMWLEFQIEILHRHQQRKFIGYIWGVIALLVCVTTVLLCNHLYSLILDFIVPETLLSSGFPFGQLSLFCSLVLVTTIAFPINFALWQRRSMV